MIKRRILIALALLAATQGSVLAQAPTKGLTMIDHKIGTGIEAVPGKTVAVHYTGWLFDPAAPDTKG